MREYEAIIGPTGPQGPQGEAGPQGEVGPQGEMARRTLSWTRQGRKASFLAKATARKAKLLRRTFL